MSDQRAENAPKPSYRWPIWKISTCETCGDTFEQLKTEQKRICETCREVSGHKGGKR